MRAVSPLTSVLDAVYAPEPDAQRWLEGIRASVASALEGHAGVQVLETVFHRNRAELAGAAAGDERVRGAIAEAHRAAEEPLVARVRSCIFQASRHMPREHPSREAALRVGIADQIAVIGMADPSHACIVSLSFTEEQKTVARSTRTMLGRLSAHLGAAKRLRLRDEIHDAVLSPDGAVVHLEREADERASRERLRDAAIRIARARRESTRDPEAGLAFWTAMVDGRWTLVERVDTDGKRLLVAKRNRPSGLARSSLSARERAVLERAALGGSLRHVSYELGLAESTVSEALSRAMSKIGVRSRAELVELYGSLVGEGPGEEAVRSSP